VSQPASAAKFNAAGAQPTLADDAIFPLFELAGLGI